MPNALEELLAEPIEAAKEREAIMFETIVDGRPLVLFGAGRLGRRTLQGARAAGREPLAFCDNNAALWGREIDGLPVLSLPQAATKFGQSAAFVITVWGGNPTERMVDRERQLREAGCRTVLHFGLLYWRYPALFPHYAANSAHLVFEQTEQIRACAELWADEASRHEYLAQVRWRLHFDFAGLPGPAAGPIYFRDELRQPLSDEIFVDCGAYDGDTVRSFLQHTGSRFKKIFAFEPDPANFAKLQATAALDPRITAVQAAVGRTKGMIPFSAEGNASSSTGKGATHVECVALDQNLKECPTLIKMDIEGFEPEALAGAREILRRDAPALAICVYHAQDHLWKIPLQIHAYNRNYKFYLRPHVYDVWDLVCYAIPHQQVRPPSTTSVAPVI
jgi:FkbM family methyltransferase